MCIFATFLWLLYAKFVNNYNAARFLRDNLVLFIRLGNKYQK